MRNTMINCLSQKVFALATTCAAIIALSTQVDATDYTWNASHGYWSSASNWSTSAVPTSTGTVYLTNGNTAGLNTVVSVAGLNVGGGMTFYQDAGGGLTVSGSAVIGNTGRALISQAAGTNSFNGGLYLGLVASSSGTYYFAGGKNTISDLYVGYAGTGTFTHNGGTNSITGSLNLGYGSGSYGAYSLNAGALSIGTNAFIGYNGTGVFTQAASSVTVTGTLTLGNGSASKGTYNLNGGTLYASSIKQGSGSATFNFGNGTLQANASGTVSVPLILNGSTGTANVNTAGYDLAVTGSISGTNSLTKSGSGTLSLSGANSFTGALNINAGTVAVTNLGAVSSVKLNGGGFNFNAVADASLAAAITGSGTVTKLGAGTLTLSGANTFTGPLNVNNGYVALSSASNLGSPSALNLNGGGIKYLASFNISAPTVTLLSGGGTFNLQGFDSTISSSITGSGSLTKLGSGTLTLSGANTFTGPLNVNEGNVAASSLNSLGSGAPINLNGGGLKFLASFDPSSRIITLLSGGGAFDTQSFNVTMAGTIVGVGGLTKLGAGTLTLSGTNTFSGPLNINAGYVTLSNIGSVSAVNLGGGGLNFNSNSDAAIACTIAGSGSLTKLGTGTLTLSGTNTFAGEINFNAGYIAASTLSNLGSASALKFNGGGLKFLAAFDPSSQSITVGSGGAFINTNAFDVTISGTIAGSGAFTKLGGGMLTLAGSNTFTGALNVNGGYLAASALTNLGSGSAINFNDGGIKFLAAFDPSPRAISIQSGTASFDTNAFDVTLSGTIAGPGSLTKLGSGTLTLAGSNTFSGALNVNNGFVALSSLGSASGVNLNGGGLRLNAAQTISTQPVALLSGGGTIDTQGYNATISSTVSGAGSLTKLGSGTLTLAGSNTFTGALNVNAGYVAASALTNLGSASALNFNGGGLKFLAAFDPSAKPISILSGGAFFDTNAFNVTMAGPISGSGTLTKLGSGALTLTGTSSLTGPVNVLAGKFVLTKTASLVSTLDVHTESGAILSVTGGTHTLDTVTGSGTTTVSGSAVLVVATLVQDSLILGGTSASEDSSASNSDVAAPVSEVVASSPITAVPEPTTLALLFFAGLALTAANRVRSKKS